MGQLANSMGGGSNVADKGQTWGQMDSSQKGAQLIGGAARGLAQGLQTYNQQNQRLRQPGMQGPNNLNFYGGS